jgi:hypothetical protein
MAPRVDIRFINGLKVYDDREIADVALRAYTHHHEYISGLLIALAFFDDGIDADCKRRMVTNLYRESPAEQNVFDAITSSEMLIIEDLVVGDTLTFFSMLKLDISFLRKDPELWVCDSAYIKASEIVQRLQVTNDVAERGIARITKYSTSHTNIPTDHVHVLQTVEANCRQFPFH